MLKTNHVTADPGGQIPLSAWILEANALCCGGKCLASALWGEMPLVVRVDVFGCGRRRMTFIPGSGRSRKYNLCRKKENPTGLYFWCDHRVEKFKTLHVTAGLGEQLSGSRCLFNWGSWRAIAWMWPWSKKLENPSCHGGSWWANALECVNFGGNVLFRTCVCIFVVFFFAVSELLI